MKLRLLYLLIGVTGIAFAADSDTKPAPRPRLTAAMLQQGMDNLPAKRRANTGVASSTAAQDMTPYPVTGGDHGMIGRTNGPSPMSRPFDLLEGGTFEKFDGTLLSAEPMLQYDAPNAGWDLLKVSR
jgi:hypothetical protein